MIRCREQPKIGVMECALLKGKLEQYEQGNYVGEKCLNQKQKNETFSTEAKRSGKRFCKRVGWRH